nr:uncharacterized protein LOC101246454 [Solanum lycopersicum]
MPLGLKNGGATYMRAMTTIFHDMIHKEIEVYVEDFIIYSRESSDHLTHLRKFFDHLRGYDLKLNPAKCAFGVPAGKLLGFIVSKRGIELHPSKIKAIQEIPPPNTIKELLKKDAPIKWTEECQTAFDAIKNNFSNPPVLVPPREGSPLLLYLSVSDSVFGCMDQPKYIFKKAMPTQKLAKWEMLLSEFDIVYVTQKAIMAQDLADRLVENPVNEEFYVQPKKVDTAHRTQFRRNPVQEDSKLSLLRCVDALEAVKLIEQIHAGVCATHMNGLTLARKIVRAGYFLMTMENDCCKFRIQESIITDNGTNLNSHFMRDIYEQFKITHKNSTAYCTQINGVVEAANKNITKILRKMIDNHREAVIPAEVEIPSLRIIQEVELSNSEWVSKRIDQLTLIDEKRMVVICHGQLYRQRMIRAFHKRVKARIFEVGQLVLKRIFPHQDEYKGKFASIWQGPYMVRKVLSRGALVLSEMDGTA